VSIGQSVPTLVINCVIGATGVPNSDTSSNIKNQTIRFLSTAFIFRIQPYTQLVLIVADFNWKISVARVEYDSQENNW